jgi:sulfur carrier protein
MTVELNGRPVELEVGAAVSDAVSLAGAGGETRGVAVAVDGEVVPRAAWEQTRLAEGQRVEVVRAIQGG